MNWWQTTTCLIVTVACIVGMVRDTLRFRRSWRADD